MCRSLGISRNSYYVWKRKQVSRSVYSNKQTALKTAIRRIWEASHRIYGRPKITKSLKREGIFVSRSYVARLMKQMGIKSIVRKKYVATTDAKHNYPIAENLLNRKFNIDEIGKIWVSDMTYIRLNNSWLYLTTMLDLADRKVVGWSLSKDMSTENTVYKAWINARNNREIVHGFILHSDRGCQYAAHKTGNLFIFNSNMKQSMSRKGNCWDNAVAESFFKTIKCELIYQKTFFSYEHVYQEIK